MKANKQERLVPQYYSEIFKLKTMHLLLPMFPNIKEWTESLSAFYAVSQHLQDRFEDPNVTVVCVGDGTTPRTAALFALRTNWNCFSVDPMLKHKKFHENIKRLTVIPKRIEEFSIQTDRLIIVGVHSHASIQNTLNSCQSKHRSMVFMPCCNKVGKMPDGAKFVYDDNQVLSDKNKVYIWDSI